MVVHFERTHISHGKNRRPIIWKGQLDLSFSEPWSCEYSIHYELEAILLICLNYRHILKKNRITIP